MNNTVARLLMFAVGTASLVLLVLFVPWWNHAPLALAAIAISGACALELSRMVAPRATRRERAFFVVTGLVPPAAVYVTSVVAPGAISSVWLFAVAVWTLVALGRFVFLKTEEGISRALPDAMASAFPLVYPGLGSAFLLLVIVATTHPSTAILWFALIAFSNDSLAWLFGMTLGKKRGIVAVSPNKSLAGFAGGMAGSVGFALLGPALFGPVVPFVPWQLALIGLLVGAADIAGDLFESAIKRSAGVKDSGVGMPGRGGFLDSFDSILFAAPVFFILVRVFGIL